MTTDHPVPGSPQPRSEAGRDLVPYVYGVALVANTETALAVQEHVLEAVLRVEAEAGALDAAFVGDIRDALEFAAREFRRLDRPNSALQVDRGLAALTERLQEGAQR